MRTKKPVDMTSEELVARFIEIGAAMGLASEQFETAKFNRLYKKKREVVRELRSRPGDERLRLLELYDHPDLQVRYNAITATYALNPEGAAAALEGIKATRLFPWAGDAGMSLSMLETGMSMLPQDPW